MNIVELFPNTLSECAKPRGNVSTCTSKHISIPVLICHRLDIQRTPDRNLPKAAVHDISWINYPTNKLVKVNRSLWRKHSFFFPSYIIRVRLCSLPLAGHENEIKYENTSYSTKIKSLTWIRFQTVTKKEVANHLVLRITLNERETE